MNELIIGIGVSFVLSFLGFVWMNYQEILKINLAINRINTKIELEMDRHIKEYEEKVDLIDQELQHIGFEIERLDKQG